MEVESSNSKRAKLVQEVEAGKQRKRKRRVMCLGITAAVVVAFILLVVILALTVFKAKRPVITINSMALQDLHTSMDILRFRVNLNLSLDVDLSVKKPNKVGFRYTNSSALLNYRGQQVGEVPIPAGGISARETEPMNVIDADGGSVAVRLAGLFRRDVGCVALEHFYENFRQSFNLEHVQGSRGFVLVL